MSQTKKKLWAQIALTAALYVVGPPFVLLMWTFVYMLVTGQGID